MLYNAAARVPSAITDLEPRDVEHVFPTSAFLVVQQAARRMLPQRKGAMFLTGASGSVKGYPRSAAFAMGMFGRRGLVQSATRELAPPGIHVAHFAIDGGVRSARLAVQIGASVQFSNAVKWRKPDLAIAYWRSGNDNPALLSELLERSRLGRLQEAIEPSQHREWQDDLAVVRVLVIAPQKVRDRPG